MCWIFIILALAVIAICYRLISDWYKYWTKKGVDQMTPFFPFGNVWSMVFARKSAAEIIRGMNDVFPNKRYFGFYQLIVPCLLVKDPDLIKQITVKDFDHFVDHRSFVPEDVDPLWGKNLITLKGQRWRDMRSTLSPAFTSNKMRFLFTLMVQNGERFVNHFLQQDQDVITIEMKDTCSRFANDIIANTVFGIECNSLSEKDNQFYAMAKDASNSSGWRMLKILAYFLIPGLHRFFTIKLFSEQTGNFFTRIVKDNIESREKHGIVRPDMMHLLLEARRSGLKYEETPNEPEAGFAAVQESEVGKNQKNVKKEITDLDITSQALIFIFAGFDTVTTLMCFASYELGINPEVQEKLIQEVDDTLEACNGKITYEALLGMKYMDMVISEALRKWPVTVASDRLVTKPYIIQPKYPDEKPVLLEENDSVSVPIFALHRNPKYFPDPDRFDPERFSEENKHKIKPYSYIPFGAGPRNCIGSRFALLETKTLFFHILAHFEIVPVEKTQIPLVLSKKSLNMTAEDGFWLGLKRRVT